MNATLYLPQQVPQVLSVDELAMPSRDVNFVSVPEQVSVLLNCTPGLVDVLASGPNYVVYSVFDCEGSVNHAAMAAVAEISGIDFDIEDEDSLLCGAVLVVVR